MTKADAQAVKRYCPNPDCPSQRRTRKGGKSRGRYLGGSEKNAYVELFCIECKMWFAWKDEQLIEIGTIILEDNLDA